MQRIGKRIVLAAGLALALAAPMTAQAQYIVSSPPVIYAPPPVVTTSYYYAPAPVTTYYAAPVTTFYAAPRVSYYAPVTVYSPPVVSPGYYTTRSYVGLGIFRPRGVYNETYYTPGTVVRPAGTTTYYTPLIGY